jgi:TolB protein
MTRSLALLGGVLATVPLLAAPALKETEPRLLYVAADDAGMQIHAIKVDGSGIEKLTSGDGNRLFPAWSPDGKRIAYSVQQANAQHIWVMDADGKNPRQLTKAEPGVEMAANRGPAWSPDGKKIAFTRYTGQGWDVFVMNADGSNLTNLSDSATYDADPAWSPDGKHIVFTSDRVGDGFRLYVMTADGKDVKELTREGNPNGFVYPAWSPDGKRIAYAHPGEGGLQIWVVDTDGSNKKQLTQLTSSNSYATWSRDGKRIAFAHFDGPKSALMVMAADGTNLKTVVELPRTVAEGGRVAWKP